MTTTSTHHATDVADAYEPVPLLKDKVVVLSGVGPGLGRSLGEEAARMGADLVLASRTERRLEKMADVVRSHGRRALVVPTDITDEESRVALVERALEEFGKVDCLINNAFGIPPMDPITTIPVEALRAANETNVFAPLRLSALFADALAASNGLDHHAELLRAVQLAAGVRRLQALEGRARAPRLVAGDRARPARHPGQLASRRRTSTRTSTRATSTGWPSEAGVTHDDIYAEKAGPTDLKRLASPEEVARAALFLASDLASAVTGQMLTVDCGEFHD